ncbi:MAG: cation:dicarboxylate symporter family transporter [Enterocloster sp.]|uniref:cation:dicarboxylate symporter family transporter n=1 Tax=Enterocloster sp. TaxID=2719315 RepID=UPI00399AA2C9
MSLTTQILIATAGGIVFGSLIGPWASNLKFIGDIFIRLIQMFGCTAGNDCSGRRGGKRRRPGCRKDGVPHI